MEIFAGIEAGGTKFNCIVGNKPGSILEEKRILTTTPLETMRQVLDFFKPYKAKLAAFGLACFGPIDLNQKSPTYGYITSTPKPGWENFNILGSISSEFSIPIGFDTDVNGAAIGEFLWGAGKGIFNLIYLTIGTGIGGGVLINGEPLHGLSHPEMGHILLKHDFQLDPFPGVCPFHHDCFEGLANGPSIAKRWNAPAEDLSEIHEAWIIEAQYIAQALQIYTCSLSPERIILGGGVMQQAHLFPLIRKKLRELLNGYLSIDLLINHMDQYIMPPQLGSRAGILGALALAKRINKK